MTSAFLAITSSIHGRAVDQEMDQMEHAMHETVQP